MIGIEQWRAVIGQCQPNYRSRVQTVKFPVNKGMLKCCVLVAVALLILSGDVETNPGPDGRKRDTFNAVNLEQVALLLIAVSPESEQISLQQTIPPNDQLVCSGGKLVYTCTTNTGILRWQEGPLGPILYQTNSALNVSQTITQFAFELIEVDVDTSLLVSTATLLMANSSHEGIRIECRDGISTFNEDVNVAEQPENCQGDVICTVSTLSENSQFSVIDVSLNSPSPISLRCVEDYEFMLGDNVARVNETSTSFIVDKTIGMAFINQTVYTVNAEGRRGMVPCIFSIAEPNAIQEVTSAQSCNGTMIAVSFIFDTPTFPPGNCLDLDQDIMEFFVSFSGNVSGNFCTQENSFEIVVIERAEFEITITPTLPDLGLSGSPFTSSVVVTALCEPDTLLNWILFVVVMLLNLIVIASVIVICQIRQNQKVHITSRRNDSDSIELQSTSLKKYVTYNTSVKVQRVAVDSEDELKEVSSQQTSNTAMVQPQSGNPHQGDFFTASDYDTYHQEPQMKELMEWISPQAAAQWKIIGTLLELPTGVLEGIEYDHSGVRDALLAVFNTWRKVKCSLYTWKTILTVLATDNVGHRKLADDIAQKLLVGRSTETVANLPEQLRNLTEEITERDGCGMLQQPPLSPPPDNKGNKDPGNSNADVDKQNGEGFTTLMIAAESRDEDKVKELLKSKTEITVDIQNNRKRTALVLASQKGFTGIVDLLLKAEADVNIKDKNGFTALMLASEGGHSEIVKLLIKSGASVNDQNNKSMTALMIACSSGQLYCASDLCASGADVNMKEASGCTALIIAINMKHFNLVGMLLRLSDVREGVNISNEEGVTALIAASKNRHKDIVICLLGHGANIDDKTKEGQTSLMIASQQNYVEVVTLLCNKGANLDIRNNDELTALDIAVQNGYQDIVHILQKKSVRL